MTSPAMLKSVRQIHNYLGVFFAPTILFFAITGGLQMFGLHETSRGSSYVPPAFLTHLSQLHKKGTLYLPQKKTASHSRPDQASSKADPSKPAAPKAPDTPQSFATHNALPIKCFFAATAIALVLSTFTGIIMAWKYARRRWSVVLVLAGGVLVPVLLLFV